MENPHFFEKKILFERESIIHIKRWVTAERSHATRGSSNLSKLKEDNLKNGGDCQVGDGGYFGRKVKKCGLF